MSLYRAEEDFPRLDQFVAERENLTRSYVKTLIDGGHITLNGQVVRAGKPIKKGDQVEVVLPRSAPFPPCPRTFRWRSSTRTRTWP